MNKLPLRFFLVFIVYLAFVTQASAQTPDANAILQTISLGDALIYKGEAKLVDIYHPAFTKAELSWQGKKITFTKAPGESNPQWQALLALGLQSKAQTAPLSIRYSDGKKSQTVTKTFTVQEKSYPVQKLTVAPKYVSPPPAVLERIKKEQQEMRTAFASVTSTRHWSVPFTRPVEGVVTSQYGLSREFNGEKRNPHRGLDLNASLGDPILAAESGVVTLVADHYYGGKTVVIDHGLGVLSAYLHMDSFSVSKGQNVNRGQQIGTVGKTGRVTGPHLHLSISVLGQSINPTLLLAARQNEASTGTAQQ